MIIAKKSWCVPALFLSVAGSSYFIPVEASITSIPSTPPSFEPTECVDEPGWRTSTKANAWNCSDVEELSKQIEDDLCAAYNLEPYDGKVITEACCFCGGSDFQLVAPSLNPTVSPSNEPSAEPSRLPSVMPTGSTQPSVQPSALPSAQHSSIPSIIPTKSPSKIPSTSPSQMPSKSPSSKPSGFPSNVPTSAPFAGPSSFPSMAPSENPSSAPSGIPSFVPTRAPSTGPSSFPTRMPSIIPSLNPSEPPSEVPTSMSSRAPSEVPTAVRSFFPSSSPSCVDEVGWKTHANGLSCAAIASLAKIQGNDVVCENTLMGPYKGKTNYEACCACGGNDSSLVAPSEVPSAGPSELPSQSVSPSSGPTRTPSTEPSAKPSSSPSNSPSASPSLCFNDPGWKFYENNGCEVVEDAVAKMSDFCDFIGNVISDNKTAKQACCICNGFNAYEMPSTIPSESVSFPS
jgi:hypothetical protein